MKYGELSRLLRRRSINWAQNLKGDELWRDAKTGKTVLIPRHRKELPRGTQHAILKQLGLTLDDLLNG